MKKICAIIAAVLVAAFVIFTIRVPKPRVNHTTYLIDGQSVELVDGLAQEGSIHYQYFGNEIKADVNGDQLPDQVFLLTADGGGSGTFYYVVAALKTSDGYKGTNGILLGDRIAPQTTEFRDGTIIVNYATRKADEPMTSAPSVGVSKYLKAVDKHLIELTKSDAFTK